MKKLTIIITITAALTALLIGVMFFIANLNQPQEPTEPLVGTEGRVSYTRSLIPIATSTTSYYDSLGTSTRPWGQLHAHYATTVAIDVYDELKVGRNATTTISEGDITTTNLTVTGTCTGCSAAVSADLQDPYNSSGADAQITLSDAKDLILYLQDTATEPTLTISSEDQGEVRLAIGSTTNAVLQTYGRIGLGTTSPGSALAINASTTILGGDVYAFGQINLTNFIGTSTTNSGLGTTTSGQLLGIGGTFLAGGNTSIIGVLDVQNAGTSTFDGGLIVVSTGGLASAQGLTITGGDILSSGKLTITSTATSSSAGGLQITGDIASAGILHSSLFTGTSTIDGYLDIDRGVSFKEAVSQDPCIAAPVASLVATIDWARGNCFAVGQLTGDLQFKHVGVPSYYQQIRIEGYSESSLFQLDLADSSTSPAVMIYNKNASTTPAEIQEGLWTVWFTATSSASSVVVSITSGGEQQ